MANRYLAVIDILGFGKMTQNNNSSYLSSLYSKVLDEFALKSLPIWSELGFISEDYKLEMIIISDTVIIWTDKPSTESFCKIVLSTQLLSAVFFNQGMPIRGCVHFGDFEVSNWSNKFLSNSSNLFLGSAISECIYLEKLIKWSGVFVTKEAISNYELNRSAILKPQKNGKYECDITIEQLEEGNALYRYYVPEKFMLEEEYIHTLDWGFVLKRFFAVENITNEFVETIFGMHGKNIDNEDVRLKIENTFQYLVDRYKKL